MKTFLFKLGLWLCLSLIILSACSSTPSYHQATSHQILTYTRKIEETSSLAKILNTAEKKATTDGRKVLVTGRRMTLVEARIIRGSCWDYANAVLNQAGFPNRRNSRQTVFKGSFKKGPYADVRLIKPGDFLYYVNHSYADVEHSSIFVDWLDYANKTALMLSYGGERRKAPARYKVYDLSHVYRIIRAR